MPDSTSGNKIVLTVLLLALLVLAGAAVFFYSAGKLDLKAKLQETENLKSPIATGKTEDLGADRINMPVPDFTFPSASGGEFGLKDLKGKLWVAEFMFTSCAGYCPEMSKMTELLQERTQDLPDLHFVSFTVDPERDSLEALKEYGAEYKADEARWHFLRASQEQVHKLGRKGFFLLNDTNSLLHSKKVALVDRAGHIRGFFDGAGPERVSDFKALEVLARQLYSENTKK